MLNPARIRPQFPTHPAQRALVPLTRRRRAHRRGRPNHTRSVNAAEARNNFSLHGIRACPRASRPRTTAGLALSVSHPPNPGPWPELNDRSIAEKMDGRRGGQAEAFRPLILAAIRRAAPVGARPARAQGRAGRQATLPCGPPCSPGRPPPLPGPCGPPTTLATSRAVPARVAATGAAPPYVHVRAASSSLWSPATWSPRAPGWPNEICMRAGRDAVAQTCM